MLQIFARNITCSSPKRLLSFATLGSTRLLTAQSRRKQQ
jgi:hypothetical protein